MMLKIASITISAMTLLEEGHTFLGFIETIFAVVLSELMRSMGKFTSVAIRTKSIFDKFLA